MSRSSLYFIYQAIFIGQPGIMHTLSLYSSATRYHGYIEFILYCNQVSCIHRAYTPLHAAVDGRVYTPLHAVDGNIAPRATCNCAGSLRCPLPLWRTGQTFYPPCSILFLFPVVRPFSDWVAPSPSAPLNSISRYMS